MAVKARTVLGWLGTAAGIAYVATLIDPHDVADAFRRIPIGAVVAAIALVGLNVVVGAARWRVLLVAYGAERRPSLALATRLYFVSDRPGGQGGLDIWSVFTSQLK